MYNASWRYKPDNSLIKNYMFHPHQQRDRRGWRPERAGRQVRDGDDRRAHEAAQSEAV